MILVEQSATNTRQYSLKESDVIPIEKKKSLANTQEQGCRQYQSEAVVESDPSTQYLLVHWFRSAFLPIDYPESVTPDYTPYQVSMRRRRPVTAGRESEMNCIDQLRHPQFPA